MGFPKLTSKTIMAPMAGITDVAFRLLCRRYGAGMCFTEMISANALARLNSRTLDMLDTCREERPIGIQLFGQNTDSLIKSAEYLKENCVCDVIDFNLGCPASKIIKQGAGSALLERPNKVKEIVEGLVGVGLPVAIKTRLGIRKTKNNVIKIAKICEEAGASAITVHARYQNQGYTGKADWKSIKLVKEKVSIPVIGNGDVIKPEDAKKMLDETGCDYVMIGRAAMGNPFLFRQCNDYIEKGKYDKLEAIEKINLFFEYLELARKKGLDFRKLKLQANYFTKGVFGGAVLRDGIGKTKKTEEIVRILERYKKEEGNRAVK
ncbi:tRNA dihydrouridine synthase DusB [Candidatus Woesearchaeota archaeon CG10_big_fil_rev_8_21_14_0_10_44_13]|nr:MAG: tRNA dihydrouridine synthase DusB [Candidatus Woesearchaeota archaeon CG10_big_fil_rev_8_21_14_0_10_44_13]